MALLAYPNGAADEAISVVDFQNPLEQLVPGHLICCHLTLQQVNRLWDATREVHQCIGCVPPIQSLVATVNPESEAGEPGNIY